MVENTRNSLEDINVLVRQRSASLFADKLYDSILRMEYSVEFNKLTTEEQKIQWALGNSEWKIIQWHDRRGIKEETFQQWKAALISRFFKKTIEMEKFLAKKQTVNQKLSEFIVDIETSGKRLGLCPENRMAFIKANMNTEDHLEVEVINEESIVTEDLISRIEDCENWVNMKENIDVVSSPKLIKPCDLALSYSNNERPLININIEGREIEALCDTGSDLNLLNASIIRYARIVGTKIKVMAANDGEIEVLGKTVLSLKVDNKVEETEFYVCKNLRYECILGTPFLRQQKAVIKFNCNNTTEISNSVESPFLKELFKQKKVPIGSEECNIDTEIGKVVCVKPYMIPQSLEEKVLHEIDALKQKGYIVESSSSWCNNMVPVAKPDGGIRITINFKLLNQLVKQDKYSLPIMQNIIHGLRGKSVFSKIDLKDGFFQIPLNPKDKHKTAFRVKNKLYEWNVMSQGYVNSAAIFQRFMDKVLNGLIGKHCYVYVDDILIFGEDEKEHDLGFEKVLERLVDAGLTGNKEKMEYKVRKIRFLGHIIEKNKIHLAMDKEEAVKNILPPKSKEEVQKFLGSS